jgi:outer membrane protein OmpA-like peptidoglycan-associated protein
MKAFVVLIVVMSLMMIGCGVNKDYVEQQIQASEARTNAEIASVNDKTDANAAENAKLRTLAAQLSEKADMALNKAKGFENYQVIWSGDVSFDFDSWNINGTGEGILMECGTKMEQVPGALVEVAGHTDRTGPASYNHMLGAKRSDAAKRFLAERFGISLYRMFTISYGEDKPVAMPDERQAASKNRRVTLKVWGEL